jgi:hypothetical protein
MSQLSRAERSQKRAKLRLIPAPAGVASRRSDRDAKLRWQ